MKRFLPFLILAAIALLAVPSVIAADAAGSDGVAAPSVNWAIAIIPIATPVLVALIRWAAPYTPKVALPILCPIIGAALDVVLHFAGNAPVGTTAGALLGLGGNGLREIIDQLGKLKNR